MTADTTYAPPPATDETADKALAVIGYVVLFAAPFVAGFPSLIAIVIALVRRHFAPPMQRTHYDFQVKIFWVGAFLMIAGVVMAVLAVATGFGLAWSAWGDLPATAFSFGFGTALLVALAALAFVANFFWMIGASIFGFARLIENRPIGRVYAAPGLPTAA
jgi:uncharacterized membrane protein